MDSFEVKRTIRNNKLLFTWGCSILLLKKRKEGPETGFLFFFFNNSDIFLKYFNSNDNLPSYSLFSKCFSWFFYLGVHRGTGVFFVAFLIFYSSSRTWPALALASRLPPFDRKRLKNCACSADPGLLNETKGSWFSLSWLSSYQNEW